MSFINSGFFKYIKNFIIGAGAAVVLVGALYKINSWEGADLMLQIGMFTEAGIFLLLGLLPPHKDYYWEKLYPGLDKYSSKISPISAGPMSAEMESLPGLNGEKVEQQLDGMLSELKTMAGSMSSLKSLQEVDFSGTSDQISKMSTFYSNMNEAMANINESIDDTKVYKEQLAALNKNLGSLNSVYGNILTAMTNIGSRD